MNNSETAKAKVILATMFRAFPSSSNMSADSVTPFMMAVEDFDLPAIEAAAKAFIKGDVPGHVQSFAPSAPELANECKRQQDRLRWEDHVESHEFVAVESEDWRKITQYRGNTPPMKTRDGVLGWFIPKLELSEARKMEIAAPAQGLPPVGIDLKRMAAGDYDGDRDIA